MKIPFLPRKLRNSLSIYSFASQSLFSASNPKTLDPTHSSSQVSYQFIRFYTNTSPISVNPLTNGSSISTPSETIITPEKSQYKSKSGNQVYDISYIIIRNGNDLESKLKSLNVSLFNDALVSRIFRVLNKQKVSAFRFFNWIRNHSFKFPCNSDIYSLVIDNFGRLDDYEGMFRVLTDFGQKGIGLNHNAFEFLLILPSDGASIKDAVKRVIELLDKVGGLCRISGIISLIQMFCFRGCFEMAKFVIELTEKRVSFYNVIVRGKCGKNDFDGARDVLNEMRKVGCCPDVGILNYLLSSLCKNDKFDEAYKMFEELLKGDCPPDSLTFEVIICHLCGTSKIELALSFLEIMVSRGLEPRLSTHAVFIKGYFNSRRYEEAYQYAVDSRSKYARAQNAIYSLLASLHEKRGNLDIAKNILSELIAAGLRPNFPVYMRVFKKLQLQGKGDLASDLKREFSNVSLPPYPNNIG